MIGFTKLEDTTASCVSKQPIGFSHLLEAGVAMRNLPRLGSGILGPAVIVHNTSLADMYIIIHGAINKKWGHVVFYVSPMLSGDPQVGEASMRHQNYESLPQNVKYPKPNLLFVLIRSFWGSQRGLLRIELSLPSNVKNSKPCFQRDNTNSMGLIMAVYRGRSYPDHGVSQSHCRNPTWFARKPQ